MPLRWYDLDKLVNDNVKLTEIFEEYTVLPLYPTDTGWLTACPLKPETKFSFVIFKDNKTSYCFDCKFQGSISGFLAQLGKMTIFEAAFTILLKKGVLLPEGYDNFKTCGELVEQYLREQKESEDDNDGLSERAGADHKGANAQRRESQEDTGDSLARVEEPGEVSKEGKE